MYLFISRYCNMIIYQAMLMKIVSKDTLNNIFVIHKYIIKLLCTLR